MVLLFSSQEFSPCYISNKKECALYPNNIKKSGVRTYAGQCAPPWCCHCVHAHWGGVLDSAYRYSRASLPAYTHTHNTHTKIFATYFWIRLHSCSFCFCCCCYHPLCSISRQPPALLCRLTYLLILVHYQSVEEKNGFFFFFLFPFFSSEGVLQFPFHPPSLLPPSFFPRIYTPFRSTTWLHMYMLAKPCNKTSSATKPFPKELS